MFCVKCFCFLVAALPVLTALRAQSADTAFKAYQQSIPGSSVQFKMVPVLGGKFTMGSPATDNKAQKDEQPQRTVTISPFWMGAYEVTHDEFDVFFNDQVLAENSNVDAVTRPTPQYIDLSWGMGREGGYPANSMQQFTALMYCRWLYQKTGIFYRLPTEAEWEYAARAGSTTIYPFGNDAKDLGKYAWYKANSNKVYHKVGQLQPNQWGLYDMLGNVAEWTLDQYDEQYFTKITEGAADPELKPTNPHPHTVRGGSFEDEGDKLRPAARRSWQADWNKRDPQIPKSRWWLTDAYFVGFRVLRPLKQPTREEAEAFYKAHLGQ
ncbi:MAG: formylglycine-generating enzyme family protein [Flavisolibacter sp.]|nr:formylglycine-generating enzyme family protein [Flavisolibacter sp.]MBD0350427.1 formylglycine-generating enzyme family protein [Flavisolibacter sp.]MBD0364671.1 formylglycine-generating enzyme family protein [Flavisolibacter sp.]